MQFSSRRMMAILGEKNNFIETKAVVGEWKHGAWYRWLLPLAVMSLLSFSAAAAAGGKQMSRIDTHAHYVPPFYYDLLNSKGITSGGRAHPRWNVTDHLALMDALNIELTVLSVSTPGARLTDSDVHEGRALARQLNEYGHMLTMTYPGRFQFFATLTLPDVEGSMAEAVYALDTLKAAGVLLLANSQGEYVGNKRLDPLMEILNAREATVFIHPSTFDTVPVREVSNVEDEDDDEIPTFVIDFLLDTTRAAANLVYKNVTGRYPNIKFLLAHSGGFLPFAAYRLGGALSMLMKSDQKQPQFEVMKQLQSFYADTALASSPSALPSTLAFIPNNQITFGTDYPYAPTFGIHIVSKQLDMYPLQEETKQKINFHNAKSLFEKSLSHWRGVWHQDESRQYSGLGSTVSSFQAV